MHPCTLSDQSFESEDQAASHLLAGVPGHPERISGVGEIGKSNWESLRENPRLLVNVI